MNKSVTAILLILSLGSALLLTGCNDQESEAKLLQSLSDIRNRPSGRIEPLPERPDFEAVRYTGSDQRSPFRLHEQESAAAQRFDSDQFQPDMSRTKSALEKQPLDSLTLVGTLQFAGDSSPSALIDDGKGQIHKVTTGQYLGQDFGRVAEISEDTVFIEETVQDEQGGWIKRPRQLKLAKNSDE